MRRLLPVLALYGFFASSCAYAQSQNPPCNAGTSPNQTILPVQNDKITYCVSDFGWSDTWLIGNPPGKYSPALDVLSGDDAFNLKYVGGVAGKSPGWISPTLDQGTLTSQPAPPSAPWTVVVATHYTHVPDATESVISNADGLQLTIDTYAPPGAFGVQISLVFKNTSSTATLTNLQLADYFNFHPNGSLFPLNLLGTTTYAAGCITTVGTPTVILNGSACGLFLPVKFEVGLAVPGIVPAVWQDVGSGNYNNFAGPLGPDDTAGAMLWNLGDLAPGASVRFAVGKNIAIIQPPALSKNFSPAAIPVNSISKLTFVLKNPNAFNLTGVTFNDTLPTNVTVTTPNNGLTGTCFSTVPVAVPGGNTVTLAGATIPGGSSCTFSVNVTSSVGGVFVNTTGQVSSNEGGTGPPATSTLTVAAPPVISKAFNPAFIQVNGASVLQFGISNPNASLALTGMGFTDPLPGNVIVISPLGSFTVCGGTLTVTPTTITLTNATLAAGSSCIFPAINVTSAVGGVYNNVSSVVTSIEGGPGNFATSTLSVASPPVISKLFTPASISVNGTSILAFTITDPNAIPLTGVGFTDTMPASVVITTAAGTTTVCGGAFTVASGSIKLTGATVLSGVPCTFSVNVTSAVASPVNLPYINTTSAVTSTEGGPGNSATAPLTVLSTPVTFSKVFAPASIPVNTTSTLSFTIVNQSTVTALTGVGFTDSMPANVTITTPPGTSAVCGGTLTIAPTSVTLTGATVAISGTCTFSVNVTSSLPGVYLNTSGLLTSNQTGGVGPATSTLTVVGPPAITKVFNPAIVPVNGVSTLSFTLKNPNTLSGLTGVGFADVFPASVVTATPNGFTSTCGGTPTITAGGITLTGASLPANGSCTMSLNVVGTASGVYVNTTGQVTSLEGGNGNTATSTLTVPMPPVISKNFTLSNIAVNGTSVLSFTIKNPNATSQLSGVGFIDVLPALVFLSNPNGLTGTCGSGVISAPAAGTTITLTNALLTAGASCTFSVNVTGAVAGIYNNATTAVTSIEGGPGNIATSTLTIGVSPPVLTKGFGLVSMGVNSTTTLTFVLTNPVINPTLTNVTFTDPLPAGLRLANPVGLSGTCDPGILTAPGVLTANPGDTFINLSNATFAPGATCTFTVNITGVMPGLQVNTTTVVTSLQAPPGPPATATIFVGNPYQLTYDANLDKGDSVLDVTNNGASGAGLAAGTTATITGSICANVYVFSPDEQLVSCCSCPVTPNGLVSLSANNDLISNTLTPVTPTSIVVKILASLPVGNSCTNSAASVTPLSLANGLAAFNQTLHMTPTGTFAPTEKPFSGGTLSAGELNRLTSLCNFTIANGSGFGVCKACRLGGLGADHQ